MEDLKVFKFEDALTRINKSTRIEQLRTYYYTWKIPNHPSDENLYKLVIYLMEIRSNLGFDYGRFKSKSTVSIGVLKEMLKGISSLKEDDKCIVEHCLAHCEILEEIEKEI